MQKVEVIGLTLSDFQRLLQESQEQAIKKFTEAQQLPSEYEELSLDQAAKELHCHKSTLRRKIDQHNVPIVKVGKEIYVQRKDLKKIKKAS